MELLFIMIFCHSFSHHLALALTSGNFRARLHKDAGKHSGGERDFNLFHPYSQRLF